MRISQKEVESVICLDGPKRYKYFINKATDQKKVWGLYDDGWALAGDAKSEVFPVWPAKEYAEICAVGVWENMQPHEINLDDFLNDLLPSLKRNKTELGLFYTPKDKGIVPDLLKFEADIRNELKRIE